MKKKKENVEILSDRDNYVKNRTMALEDFAEALKEVQRDKPSVDGIICGMDFKQFSLASIFREIRAQEGYTKYTKHPVIDFKEEKVILKQMIKDAKDVFKKDYQRLYDHYNKGSTDYD